MNIVIAGGGTAGWLAALFFINSQPNKHKVTLIESTELGIIGAGEGSTRMLTHVLNNKFFDTGSNISEFIQNTDATIKLGIRHKNWTGDGSSYYAPLDGTATYNFTPDVDFLNALYKYGTEGMHVSSKLGRCFRDKNYTEDTALHFDGTLIGKHFKNILGDKVNYLDGKISDVVLKEDGSIKSLILENKEEVFGDLFIDCTGFSRILMKSLNVGWKSYSESLPVNTAIPFILPRENIDPEPLTIAHALSSGWMWQIPTASRIGCGYVFSDEYISVEDAQKEVEELLGHKINPIKIIKFESGRSDVLWEKNCIALGLASSFAEPLEATSIHTTIVQLRTFCFEFMSETWEKTYSNVAQERYNYRMKKLYDDIRDFLIIHYRGGRTDSEFWKYMSSEKPLTPFSKEILDKSKDKVPGIFQYDRYYGYPGPPLWNWVLAGTNNITRALAKKQLELYGIIV
jgi:tryptophan halogenase